MMKNCVGIVFLFTLIQSTFAIIGGWTGYLEGFRLFNAWSTCLAMWGATVTVTLIYISTLIKK